MRLHYEIKGMSCAACVAHVERAIRSVLSSEDTVNVSLLTNSVSILTVNEPNKSALEASLARAVKAAGYELITDTQTPKKDAKTSENRARVRNLILSAAFTVALMYLSMGGMIGLPQPPFLKGASNGIWMALAQLALTLPVLVINFKFFKNGFRALFHLSPNMDSLIALGAGASVIYGLFAIVMIATAKDASTVHTYLHDLYFESAAMILTLVSLGKLLESRAKDKASDAVRSLATLAPKYATVLRDGKEISLPVEEIRVGDRILIRAGEWIPVDGVVVSGSGSTDESALTGESMPVEKEIGSPIRAACVLTAGAVTVEARAVGEDTSLSRIIKLLEDAASSKAPIARVADKVSSVFVPVVMCISLFTLGVWLLATRNVEQALRSAIAVLVISCPCALGLATPTAITVGVGRGARNGILFRDAESLEKLCSVDTVMFDKTGTLTEGKPSLTDLVVYGENDPQKVLTLAAAVERLSSHPLALAVRAGAEELGIENLPDVTDFENLVGAGACGRVGGVLCRVGKPDPAIFDQKDPENASRSAKNAPRVSKNGSVTLCRREYFSSLKEDFEALESDGKTAVLVTLDARPVAILGISDRVRADAAPAIEALQGAGVRCVMLTGDNERTAASVAREVGLDDYRASLLPEDKERCLREACESGSCAMVGDGINDAPALVRADVGIAVGAGTEVAIDCAGVVLSQTSISGVADAYALSRATIRIIKQNLFWALFYNAVCIPVAAGVFFPLWGWQLSPMLASAAMSFSSVFVVTNALRLRSVKLRKKGENSDMLFKKKELKVTTLHVEGMMCQHCVAHVKAALEGVKGVKSVTVDLDAKTATVEAPESVSAETLASAVVSAGYQVV
ncbi:MAG: heavy metal translocating P-type ATPase [Clostridia bacterium]|nr:heavy metal translocating P-type ATPase [Clostridia bacterium]